MAESVFALMLKIFSLQRIDNALLVVAMDICSVLQAHGLTEKGFRGSFSHCTAESTRITLNPSRQTFVEFAMRRLMCLPPPCLP